MFVEIGNDYTSTRKIRYILLSMAPKKYIYFIHYLFNWENHIKILTFLQRVSDILDGSVQVYFVWDKTTEAVTIITLLWQWMFIWRQPNSFSLLAWSCALLLLSDEFPIMPINFCDVNFVLFEEGKGWYESKIMIKHEYSGCLECRIDAGLCLINFNNFSQCMTSGLHLFFLSKLTSIWHPSICLSSTLE